MATSGEPPAVAHPAWSGGIGELPFVGRAGVFEQVVASLQGGDPRSFLVAGPPGVGKTRLATEVSAAAADLGYDVAQVLATPASTALPLRAFAPLLPAEFPAGGLAGLLDRLVRVIVERAATERRLLLVVDDAQSLDELSAALVLELAHTSSCRVLANLQTPGPVPGPITTMWKDGAAIRIDLTALAEGEVEEVVSRALGGPVAGASLRWLWRTSAGNALYLRELLVAAAEAGALEHHGGVFALRLPLKVGERLRELISARLAGLSPAAVELLEMLAIGEPLGFGFLESVAGAEVLAAVEGAGLVLVTEQRLRAEVGLVHPLYAEVLRQRMPRAQLRRLSQRLATSLEGTGARRHDDVLRIAKWRVDAGLDADPELLTAAARSARDHYDLELAATLARGALQAGAGVEAGLVLGEAEFMSGRGAEAERVLAGLASTCATDDQVAVVASARAYNLSVVMGDKQAGVRVAEEALASVDGSAARLRLQGRLAVIAWLAGDLTTAVAHAAPLVTSGVEALVHRGTFVTSWARAQHGDAAEAVATAYRGLRIHRSSTDRTQLPESQLAGATLGNAAMGRLAKAEEDARAGYEASLEAGDDEGVATFSLLRGLVSIDSGALEAASQRFREAAAMHRRLLDRATLRWSLGGIALAAGMTGNAGAAAGALAELDELPPHWMSALEADTVGRGRAWALVAAGEHTRARAVLREAATWAAEREHRVAEAHLLHDLARLGLADEVAPRLFELAGRCHGEWVRVLAEHAAVVARRDGEGLERSGGRLERTGALLLAAEAYRAAAGALRNEGLLRRATACERRADELAAACGRPRTPGLAGDPAVGDLTPRQHEIAVLAASGATNKEIGARLYLSTRTVGNHLHMIYAKLGVTSRGELAGALGAVRAT